MQTFIAKSDRFKVQASLDPSARMATLLFLGDLNEEVKLNEISGYLRKLIGEIDRATLDLEGLRTLNSAGMRQWISFIEELPSEYPVFFSRVSEVLVDQANFVPNIFGPTSKTVLSVFAPYVCEKCGSRSRVEIKTDGLMDAGKGKTLSDLREKPCPLCGGRAELDGLIDEYFGFLVRRA